MTHSHEKNVQHSCKKTKELGQKVEANIGGSGHRFLCNFSSGTEGWLFEVGQRQEGGRGNCLVGFALPPIRKNTRSNERTTPNSTSIIAGIFVPLAATCHAALGIAQLPLAAAAAPATAATAAAAAATAAEMQRLPKRARDKQTTPKY